MISIFTRHAAAARVGEGLEVGHVSCKPFGCIILLSFRPYRLHIELLWTRIYHPLLPYDDMSVRSKLSIIKTLQCAGCTSASKFFLPRSCSLGTDSCTHGWIGGFPSCTAFRVQRRWCACTLIYIHASIASTDKAVPVVTLIIAIAIAIAI